MTLLIGQVRFLTFAACFACAALGHLPPAASGAGPSEQETAIKAAAALYEGIRTETLDNGLQVYLKPVPGSPVVTTMVAYRVGSADEDLNNTGLSHYLEHLMFKGTDKIMPGDIDRLTLRNGGENNANTSEDCTIFHFDFAADRWDGALRIEADRMRNLRIDARHEFEKEKGAVIEELQRNEDSPWDLEEKTILPLLFGKNNPYGHPVIGERAHVRGATAPVIKAHYDRWYHPNNAVLVVCGGFDPDRALARIKELFGPIPAGKLPPRKTATAVTRDHPVRKTIESKFDSPRMLMGFNTLRTEDKGSHALDVVQAILSGGKTGRLYKKLVEGASIANSVNSQSSTGRYPGWFAVEVELLKGNNPERAENLVLEELKQLRDHPVDVAELNRAKRGILAGAIFGRESVHSLADSIARGVMVVDLAFLKDYLPKIDEVTAQDVQDVARRFLNPEKRVVVWSIPPTGGSEPAGNAEKKSTGRMRRAPAPAGEPSPSLKSAKRVVLDNGLTLLLLENHRLPIVVARAFVRDVRMREPEEKAGVAALTGQLLDEGTKRHKGPEIAELIENVGGSLTFSSSEAALQVLSPDRALGLGLLFECLVQPRFPEEAFARERQRLLAQIDDAEQQPDTRASMVFEADVYGPHHPLGRPSFGRKATVERLTPADCQALHRRLFVPNNCLVAVVGDFTSSAVVAEIERLSHELGWKKSELAKLQIPPIGGTAATAPDVISMPKAVQLHLYMGHLGIRRSNPDFYKLLVMDYILGTGPGFTDRLSARLRDREGLAYTVTANITSSAREEPGVFMFYIGTAPQYFDHARSVFLEEVERLRREAPSKEEVEDAKQYLLGSLPFQMTGSARIAGHLISVTRFGLGLDYFERYRDAVSAVTAADVQTMAQKHLDTKRMVLAAAGPIDARGRLLKEAAKNDRR